MGSAIQNRENMQITNINFLFECMNEAWLTVSVFVCDCCMYECVRVFVCVGCVVKS